VSMSEVKQLLAAFQMREIELDELADRFRGRSWPIARRPAPTNYAEMAEQQDPEPDVPGSFDEVTAAYDRGELTREQYRTLAHAVAEAINADARREAE
jgi:hypothetical protein